MIDMSTDMQLWREREREMLTPLQVIGENYVPNAYYAALSVVHHDITFVEHLGCYTDN